MHLRKGDPGQQIAQLAADLGADLIVVGAHKGDHLRKLVVDSTAERVMASATCPVVIAGPRPKPQPSHIIVIEAACQDCVNTRFDTRGKDWWCARHSEHHPVMHRHHHIYSCHSELPFSEHDSEVSATGVD